jgi:hypothetical protein
VLAGIQFAGDIVVRFGDEHGLLQVKDQEQRYLCPATILGPGTNVRPQTRIYRPPTPSHGLALHHGWQNTAQPAFGCLGPEARSVGHRQSQF